MAPTPLADVLARLQGRLGPPAGDPVPLDGGMTGRTFRVHMGDGDYVVHLGGKDTRALGISRAAECEATEAAARIGIGPEVVTFLRDEDVLVTRYLEGRPLRAEEVAEPDVLADLAESLKTLHRGPRLPQRSSPFRRIEEYRATTLEHGAAVDDRFDAAHALVAEIEGAMRSSDHDPVPCHGDLAPDNLVYDGARVHIVDWEYAGMGDRFFDLGDLSANARFDEGDEEWLLTAYFNEPPTARRFAALRLMRLVAALRDAMWGTVQQAISRVEYDYAGYAREHWDRFAEESADPQVRAWLEQAAAG
jgi:thiamine kinase-like enzyme